jgi:voltage-gated potassium channel
MASMTDPANREEENGSERTKFEREELLHHLEAFLEPLLASLGLLFLALLFVDLSGAVTTPEQRFWLDRAINVIWVIFVVDFVVRLIVAPEKRHYLKRNWLTLLSLALPFLRPIRALQALRAVRSLSLIRLLSGVNRGMRVLQTVTRGRQIAYVAALSILVVIAGAVGVHYFDRGVPGAPIQTFGDAVWWSSAMITTINNELYAVSPEARVIAILQRIFAVSVFGFITASIASYFIGRSAEERAMAGVTDRITDESLRIELVALRQESDLLRREVDAIRQNVEYLVVLVQPPSGGVSSTGESGLREDQGGP